MDPLEFILTCSSTEGPATTVEWWRSGKLVQEDSNHKTSQVIVSTSPTGFLAAVAYKSFLKVKGRHTGRYHCDVSNAFPSSKQSEMLIILCKLCICSIMFLFIVTSSLHASAPQIPTQLTATYKSNSSVLLEWTYSTAPTIDYRYIVYYESQEGSRSESFRISHRSDNMYMHTLTGLPDGGIHNISLVAIQNLSSPVVGLVAPGLSYNHCMIKP